MTGLYVAGAGFVAIAWEPETPLKAIWIGASLPALISTLQAAAPQLPDRTAAE